MGPRSEGAERDACDFRLRPRQRPSIMFLTRRCRISIWRTAMSFRVHASGLWDDVRFGGRGLSKRVGAASAIVLTLAIAFAASTLVYSTIDVVQRLIPAP